MSYIIFGENSIFQIYVESYFIYPHIVDELLKILSPKFKITYNFIKFFWKKCTYNVVKITFIIVGIICVMFHNY